MTITYTGEMDIDFSLVTELFAALGWSSGRLSQRLEEGLRNHDIVLTAWDDDELVGMVSALTDGHMVLFVSYMGVRPEYQGRGIGTRLMEMLLGKYPNIARRLLTASEDVREFYERFGFEGEESRVPMFLRVSPKV